VHQRVAGGEAVKVAILSNIARTLSQVAFGDGETLYDADLQEAVTDGVTFINSGQSCNAPTRMLVPHGKMRQAATIAKSVVEKAKASNPKAQATTMGPSSIGSIGTRGRVLSRRASTRVPRWSLAGSADPSD
jgi:hypothetical protein